MRARRLDSKRLLKHPHIHGSSSLPRYEPQSLSRLSLPFRPSVLHVLLICPSNPLIFSSLLPTASSSPKPFVPVEPSQRRHSSS